MFCPVSLLGFVYTRPNAHFYSQVLLVNKSSWEGCHMQGSLAYLKTRGYMVSFGQSSRTPDPFSLVSICTKITFLDKAFPMLSLHGDELLETTGEVCTNSASSVLRVRVNHTYPLS